MVQGLLGDSRNGIPEALTRKRPTETTGGKKGVDEG